MQYIRTTESGEVVEAVKTVDGDGLTSLHFVGFAELPDEPAVYAGDVVVDGVVTVIGPAHKKAVRDLRDTLLNAVLWKRDRHRDELELGQNTTLTQEQFHDLLVHIQALRDVTKQTTTIDALKWPSL